MCWKEYLIKFWNFWPPFLFSGIKVEYLSKDFREIKVRLKLRFYNANYVGTQFGGLLYTMADPFYMIMLMKNLGPKYKVWDKEGKIVYKKPGRSDVTAHFYLTAEDIDQIEQEVQEKGKTLWMRKIAIVDNSGELIAEVEKLIFIGLALAEGARKIEI